MKRNHTTVSYPAILLAGLAGGMAEILWVAAYSNVHSISSATVARQITASLWPAAAEAPFAPALGILIHLVLSIALVAMAAPLLSRAAMRYAGYAAYPANAMRLNAGFMIAGAAFVLALVWMANFFAILPIINPAFITLMPYSASLASKLLFGVTMGFILYNMSRWKNEIAVSADSNNHSR